MKYVRPLRGTMASGHSATLPKRSKLTRYLLDTLDARERGVWAVALAGAAFDLCVTVVGLAVGLVETNPVAAAAFDTWGVIGLAGLKGLAVAVVAVEWYLLPAPYRVAVPAAVALPWTLAGGYNVWMLWTVGA